MNLPWMKHCGHCGGENNYDEKQGAFVCQSCGKMAWPQNKTAVCVSVPVHDGVTFKGLIYTERAIPPVGAKCLVSGFQDYGEHYFTTAAREFQEEVFGQHKAEEFILEQNKMTLDGIYLGANGYINIICVSSDGVQLKDIAPTIENFTPNNEVQGVFIATEPIEMEWSIHTDFMAREFKRINPYA